MVFQNIGNLKTWKLFKIIYKSIYLLFFYNQFLSKITSNIVSLFEFKIGIVVEQLPEKMGLL